MSDPKDLVWIDVAVELPPDGVTVAATDGECLWLDAYSSRRLDLNPKSWLNSPITRKPPTHWWPIPSVTKAKR